MKTPICTLFIFAFFNLSNAQIPLLWGMTSEGGANGSGAPTTSQNDVMIYPNPTSDILIVLSTNFSINEIEIFSMMGMKVFKDISSSNEIDFSTSFRNIYSECN